jgi:hypothetical protein
MPAMVVAAFCDSGRLKADTPFEIVSTPVRAVQPAENARNSKNSETPSTTGGDTGAGAAGKLSPDHRRSKPDPTMQKMAPMKI